MQLSTSESGTQSAAFCYERNFGQSSNGQDGPEVKSESITLQTSTNYCYVGTRWGVNATPPTERYKTLRDAKRIDTLSEMVWPRTRPISTIVVSRRVCAEKWAGPEKNMAFLCISWRGENGPPHQSPVVWTQSVFAYVRPSW